MKGNRKMKKAGKEEVAKVCLECTEPECNGGFKGCPYSQKYGLEFKRPYLVQNSCGYPEPFEPDDFYYK